MDACELIAERKIREAMEEGAFDGLEGCGRPLDLREDPYEPPGLRMAHRLLRNNGFVPAWVEEGREIDAALARLGAAVADQRFEPERIALNSRILAFNLKAPCAAQRAPVPRFSK